MWWKKTTDDVEINIENMKLFINMGELVDIHY